MPFGISLHPLFLWHLKHIWQQWEIHVFLVVGRFGASYYKALQYYVDYIVKAINDKSSISTVVGFLRPKGAQRWFEEQSEEQESIYCFIGPKSSAMAARNVLNVCVNRICRYFLTKSWSINECMIIKFYQYNVSLWLKCMIVFIM